MKRSLSLFAAALGLALTATAQSQANTPYSYTYNWNALTVGSGSPSAIAAGTGGVSFTNEDPVTTTIPTDTAASNITVFSSALDGSPDVIPTPGGGFNYTVSVTLTDNQGNPAATINFNGLLTGQLTHDSSSTSNTIVSYSDTQTSSTHLGTFDQVTIGKEVFTVSYSGYAAPGPEAQHNKGAISFHISYSPVIDGGGSPEPSSVVLGCLGLSFLGGVAWRARRRKAALLKAV